jgi:two-component system, OmpR family, sensor histidine kinase KdpD
MVVAVLGSVVVATSLGAAIAAAEAGSRTLAVVALIAFLLTVVGGVAWGLSRTASPDDALVERAETAASMAHELRSPLMAIKGLASTGVRLFDEMSEDERRDFFRMIDEEAVRLRRIIDQAAEAMAVDADRVTYDLRGEDLGAFVEGAAWAAPHGEHPMTVSTAPGITVALDRKHLAAVVGNLVDNAAKFSPPDAPIDVDVRSEDDAAVIDVADRGPGVPLDRRGDVFERFARWRPAGYEETPGAGLGLFLARAHVGAHGGSIEIVDRDDGGSILRVRLPEGGSS